MEYEVKRGDIYSANFSDYIDEPRSAIRPCVIISNDRANRYADAVTVVPVTSQPKKPMPTHVGIGTGAGLYKPSIAMCEKIITINKIRLHRRIGSIQGTDAETSMDAAICIALGIQA